MDKIDKQPIAVELTDTHLSEHNILSNRLIFQQTIEFCVDNQIKTIIHGGDVFHSRKSQSQSILIEFEHILDHILEAGLQMICIVGNHDKTDYDSKDSFLSSFKHHPALRLIETYDWITLENTDIAFLSYFNDTLYNQYLQQLNETLDQYCSTKHPMLFTHIGVSGARMNNGVAIESDVTVKQFRRFNTVKIGHYHDGQSFGNIHYIGASCQHNFGERVSKGLQVIYSDHSTELVELDFPQYLKFEVDVNTLTQKDLDDLRQEKEISNNFLRIILVGEEQDVKSYNIQALKQVGVDVQLKVPEVEMRELQTRIEPFTAQALQDQFALFCEQNELNYEQGMIYFSNIA